MAEKFINQERISELWGKIKTLLGDKVDKVAGKGLSTEDYTTAEKTKLAGIATGANNYTHPANHPPSIITQDASNRFVTDTQISTWNAKANASHTHTKANITDFPENMPPTAHTHGGISDDGKIGTTPDLPVFTGIGGVLATKTISTAQALLGIEPGAAKIATGSYTGTGTFGWDNKNSLTFGFVPKIVFIMSSERLGIFMNSVDTARSINRSDTNPAYANVLYVSWSGNTMQWYAALENADVQLNAVKSNYYVAIG